MYAALAKSAFDPATLPDRYALRIQGMCMSPVIADGAVVAFSRTELPRPGDFVVLWFRPECTPLGVPAAQVKKLTGRDGPNLFIERFVPHGYFSVHPSELVEVHKAIGIFPASKGAGGSHDFATLRPF